MEEKTETMASKTQNHGPKSAAFKSRPLVTITPQVVTADVDISFDFLERKFSRPQRQPGQIIYELTTDPGYLHQYYLLREQMFINIWGLQNFNGQKDEYDDVSDIMIARIGNQVIGGCRLTFSTRENNKLLPMEKRDFLLAEELPGLMLTNEIYVEISRMAILPEFQNSVALLELSRQLLKRAAEKKARYAFSLAPTLLARNYRKAASLFDLKWQIRNDVNVPDRREYEGIKMTLSMLDLAPVYDGARTFSKKETTEAL